MVACCELHFLLCLLLKLNHENVIWVYARVSQTSIKVCLQYAYVGMHMLTSIYSFIQRTHKHYWRFVIRAMIDSFPSMPAAKTTMLHILNMNCSIIHRLQLSISNAQKRVRGENSKEKHMTTFAQIDGKLNNIYYYYYCSKHLYYNYSVNSN